VISHSNICDRVNWIFTKFTQSLCDNFYTKSNTKILRVLVEIYFPFSLNFLTVEQSSPFNQFRWTALVSTISWCIQIQTRQQFFFISHTKLTVFQIFVYFASPPKKFKNLTTVFIPNYGQLSWTSIDSHMYRGALVVVVVVVVAYRDSLCCWWWYFET
jgi:hypothetical protein